MKLTRRTFVKGGVLAAAGMVAGDSLWFEHSFIRWNEYIRNSHPDAIKLIQISDLHLRNLRSHHTTLAERVNQENPDLLIFTGDTIDDYQNMSLLRDFLSLIHPGIQKIAIPGNWEHWGRVDFNQLKELFASHNCTFLVNEATMYHFKSRSISIAGVDDWVGGYPDLTKIKEAIRPADMTIFLSHCPGYRDVLEKEKGDMKIDYVFSGHTHGGQVNLLGWVIYKPKGSGKYLSGWYEESEPKLYVSKGVGTSLFPVRFGSRAEVSLFYI